MLRRLNRAILCHTMVRRNGIFTCADSEGRVVSTAARGGLVAGVATLPILPCATLRSLSCCVADVVVVADASFLEAVCVKAEIVLCRIGAYIVGL